MLGECTNNKYLDGNTFFLLIKVPSIASTTGKNLNFGAFHFSK